MGDWCVFEVGGRLVGSWGRWAMGAFLREVVDWGDVEVGGRVAVVDRHRMLART